MPPTQETDSPEFAAPPQRWRPPRSRRVVATWGLALGLFAILLAAIDSYLATQSEPAPPRERASAKANRLLREIIQRQEEPHAEPPPGRHPVGVVSLVLGAGAIGCGLLAWTRHERLRPAAGAVALGLIAVAWQWVLIGVGAAIAIFLLGHLLSG